MKQLWAISSLMFVCICASACLAVPTYRIETLGFDDFEHTAINGLQTSAAQQLNEAGKASGYSLRYNGSDSYWGQSAWLYDTEATFNIGLTDSEHTRNDGFKYSEVTDLNEAGQAYGISYRYNGKSIDLGRSVWLYDGTTTVNIGLIGSEYTRSDGRKFSFAGHFNEAGQVGGFSRRYLGSLDIGTSAWIYDGASTIAIGLTGSEHTRNDGSIFSRIHHMNEAGQVLGFSDRYNGGNDNLGTTVWYYNGVATIPIGFTDNAHTRSNGYKNSHATQLSESGRVIGLSNRYNGSLDFGNSAWLYDGITTIALGLSGSEYTRGDGYKNVSPHDLNEAGKVVGTSERFDASGASLGLRSWLYDGVMTIEIGPTGSEYTASNGYRSSYLVDLNETGQAIGTAARANGDTFAGQSAWFYDGATTKAIGLIGGEHTDSNGHRRSDAIQLNEAGQVSGTSHRYNGGDTDLGKSAWVYNGVTTADIGLKGPEYTRADGYEESIPLKMNDAGQIHGISYRYNGGVGEKGQDAWFYDPDLDQTFTLQLSKRSDGYAFSRVDYWGDDGLILGSYALYDEFDNAHGRAFYFTVADGLHDLGSLVDGGLGANGWNFLGWTDIQGSNSFGLIRGRGQRLSPSYSDMAYLLTPITADFNNDGHIDGRDFLAWQRGESPRPLSAADLALWQQQYGDGNSLDAVSAVPEPHGLILVFSSLLLAARVRQRGR